MAAAPAAADETPVPAAAAVWSALCVKTLETRIQYLDTRLQYLNTRI